MKVICAYCGKLMGMKDGNGVLGTSHGVCLGCFEDMWQRLQDYPAKREAPPDPGEPEIPQSTAKVEPGLDGA